MTPEQAQELLDIANRGAGDGQRPVTVAAKYAPLAEAAYALAQTVAGMRYEYALEQTGVDGPEIVTKWLPHMGAFAGYPGRIVRRLVSAPEVVE